MSEHFTRNTESVRCWCHKCQDMTEHPVSNGEIQRCPIDHTKTKPTPRPKDVSEPIFTGAASSAASREAEKLRQHMLALDGPSVRHDADGGLPQKRERNYK